MKKFCDSISEKLINVDIFGQRPQFNIDRNDSFKTNFGTLLTFTSIITTILALSYFSLQLFNVSNPKLVFSVKNIFNPPLIYLNNSNYGFTFGLQNPFTYDQFTDETVYRAEAYHMTGKRVVKGNTTFFDWNVRKLELEICSIDKFPFAYHKLFKDLPFKNLYCLKNTSFSLFGTFLNEEYQYIKIKLFECKNNTSTLRELADDSLITNNNSNFHDYDNNNNNKNIYYNKGFTNETYKNYRNENGEKSTNIICKPKQYIDEILAGTFFTFSHTDLTIDPTNYTNPNQIYGGDSYTTVSNKFFKEMHHYLNVINFATDKGWLVSDIENQTFLKLDFIKEMTDFRKSDNFLSYTVKLSTKVESYSRSFAKVQNIAAEAGGFLKMISLVCLLASFYYNKSKFYELIGEAILSEKVIDSKNNKTVSSEFDSSSQIKLDSQNPFYLEFLRKNENSFIPNNNAKINNFFNENTDNITATNQNNNVTNKSVNTNIHGKNINFNNHRKSSNKNINKSNSPKKCLSSKPKEKESSKNIVYKEEEIKNAEIAKVIPKRTISKRIRLRISFCESFSYLFCYGILKKNENFRKLNVVRHKVDELLDILNLFRTMNDFERFKKLMFDKEQLKLFNLPYYQEISLADPVLFNQTMFSIEKGKKKQKDINGDVLYNLVAKKEDTISKKLLYLVNG